MASSSAAMPADPALARSSEERSASSGRGSPHRRGGHWRRGGSSARGSFGRGFGPRGPPVGAAPSTSSASDPESAASVAECLVCAEPRGAFVPVGPCNHREVCTLCWLRKCLLYKDRSCPVCKTPADALVLSDDLSKPFDGYRLADLTHDEASGVYLEPSCAGYFERLRGLQRLSCPVRGCPDRDRTLPNKFLLRQHLKRQHNLEHCNVCLEHRMVFIQEQTVFSRPQLSTHMRDGDKALAIKHEECQFCRTTFFDIDHLYEHLKHRHERCHLCEQNGNPYQYFVDFPELERHFEDEHYPCREPSCLAKKFVVFKSQVDLQLHEVEAHLASRGLSRADQRRVQRLALAAGSSVSAIGDAFDDLRLAAADAELATPPRSQPPAAEEFPALSGPAASSGSSRPGGRWRVGANLHFEDQAEAAARRQRTAAAAASAAGSPPGGNQWNASRLTFASQQVEVIVNDRSNRNSTRPSQAFEIEEPEAPARKPARPASPAPSSSSGWMPGPPRNRQAKARAWG